MTDPGKKSGYSLTELIVVVSIIGMLVGAGLPAVKQVVKSFESSARVRDVIAAAFSNARAIAIKEGKHAGVRFQRNAEGDQYMIFIIQDEDVDPGHLMLAGRPGFRAMRGKNPMRLPKEGGVLDLRIKDNYSDIEAYKTDRSVKVDTGGVVDTDASNESINRPFQLLDAETFSVVFSPQGKLVLTDLRVACSTAADGDIFNTVSSGSGMFIQDDVYSLSDAVQGLQLEPSRNNFVIIDKAEFNSADVDSRWSDYLQFLKPLYVNPYSGTLID